MKTVLVTSDQPTFVLFVEFGNFFAVGHCPGFDSDLEKVASGASGACGHFVGNHAILRTFLVKYSVRIEEEDVTVDNWCWIKEI